MKQLFELGPWFGRLCKETTTSSASIHQFLSAVAILFCSKLNHYNELGSSRLSTRGALFQYLRYTWKYVVCKRLWAHSVVNRLLICHQYPQAKWSLWIVPSFWQLPTLWNSTAMMMTSSMFSVVNITLLVLCSHPIKENVTHPQLLFCMFWHQLATAMHGKNRQLTTQP